MASSRLEKIGTIFTRVEGLLSKGAMKVTDRPIWFDVYKKFPPIDEPKFARPKVDLKPIKQIFYEEDIIRAKFHSKGHGMVLNMMSRTGETHIKKLISQYKKLQSEGIDENEIIEKCVSSVVSDRIFQKETVSQESKSSFSKEPKSSMLSETDLKNILEEK